MSTPITDHTAGGGGEVKLPLYSITAESLLRDAWSEFGGNMRDADYWHAFSDATNFAVSQIAAALAAHPTGPGEAEPVAEPVEFDAGCFPTGGRDADWWHDAMRQLLASAHDHYVEQFRDLATPLKERAEPVAWAWEERHERHEAIWNSRVDWVQPEADLESDVRSLRPLYEHPPAGGKDAGEVAGEAMQVIGDIAGATGVWGHPEIERTLKYFGSEGWLKGEQIFPFELPDQSVGGMPSGWRLVPVEASEQMCDAAFDGDKINGDGYAEIWRAMLAAAPTPPAGNAGAEDAEELDDGYESAWNKFRGKGGPGYTDSSASLAFLEGWNAAKRTLAPTPAEPAVSPAGGEDLGGSVELTPAEIEFDWAVEVYWREHAADGTATGARRAGLEAVAALLPAASRPAAGREEIARIIDPETWADWDRHVAYRIKGGDIPDGARASANRNYGYYTKRALAKADQILALLDASRGEPDGWLTIETAPKDGTLIGVPGGCANWNEDGQYWYTAVGHDIGRPIQWEVTHWKNLDPSTLPPAGQTTEER